MRTPVYEGPLELILELIEKRKLLVNDFSLASITDDFIQHVRAQETFPVEETANFIAAAATLLLIKSKSLIPTLALTEEETEDVDDLKRRLALYEKTREAASGLARLFGKEILYARGYISREPIFSPGRDLSLAALTCSLEDLLANREEATEPLPEARVRPVRSLEETMEALTARVQSALTLSFREFSGFGNQERVDVIVSFLALLELVKQGAVEVAQYDLFEDIHITNAAPRAVPRYDRP